jgi:hypothetical protein
MFPGWTSDRQGETGIPDSVYDDDDDDEDTDNANEGTRRHRTTTPYQTPLTLLPELRLALLHRRHDHVASGGGGETVQAGTETDDRDDVEV